VERKGKERDILNKANFKSYRGTDSLKFWAYKSIENCVVCSLYKFVGRVGETYSIKLISNEIKPNHTWGQTP
jgi:hypothetical protein